MTTTTTTDLSTTSTSVSSGAANALSLLLREDPLLIQHGLTSYRGTAASESGIDDGAHENENNINNEQQPASSSSTIINPDDAAHSYAAALLHNNTTDNDTNNPAGWMTSSGEYRQRATEALAEVDRKLALVESLSQRISREAPEEVAGPLLRLHGFELVSEDCNSDVKENKKEEKQQVTVTTLTATRDKAERIKRQSQLLDTVAKRVESTLLRGVTRMESATTKLSRVLDLSATLKMILRLQFEARKVLSSSGSGGLDGKIDLVDLRDLTRAAASVAAMEELLSSPMLTPPTDDDDGNPNGGGTIDVVEKLRPELVQAASSVRQAAAGLMNELQNDGGTTIQSSASSLSRLGATLQVYFHLGELSDATWKSVSSALASTEKASSQLFHPTSLKKMKEAAQAEAKSLAESELSSKNNKDGKGTEKSSSSSGGTDKKSSDNNNPRQRKKQYESIYNRLYHRKLREKRASAASKWSTSINDAASRVWNLHRVLSSRNDPVTRTNFLEVVSESCIPKEFSGAELRLLNIQNRNKDGSGGGGGGDGSDMTTLNKANFSIFSLFWVQMSIGLGGRIQRLIKYDNGSLESDVAALYPAVRSTSLSMVTELYDMQMGSLSSSDIVGDTQLSSGMGISSGVMGGSSGLEDSVFLGGGALGGGMMDGDDYFSRADEAAGGFFGASADAWTHVEPTVSGDAAAQSSASVDEGTRARSGAAASASSSSTLAVFSSSEWTALQGEQASDGSLTGLLALQNAFLKECKKRLFAPLEFMFPEAVSVDENGDAIPCLPTLPSRYDLAKLDANIREELSLADPRQGGGDYSMATMISEMVVSMLHEFCIMARRAISDIGEDKIMLESESMKHNLNVAGVMVRQIPVFVVCVFVLPCL